MCWRGWAAADHFSGFRPRRAGGPVAARAQSEVPTDWGASHGQAGPASPMALQGPQLSRMGYGRAPFGQHPASERARLDGVAVPCVIALTSPSGPRWTASSTCCRSSRCPLSGANRRLRTVQAGNREVVIAAGGSGGRFGPWRYADRRERDPARRSAWTRPDLERSVRSRAPLRSQKPAFLSSGVCRVVKASPSSPSSK